MAGYIGSKSSVTLVDGYTEAEADAEFVNDPNGAITVSGSNVGIGVSPSYKLDVASTVQIRAGESLRLQNVAGSSTATIQCAGAGTNSDLGFSTANTERLRIDSSGRVTTPYQPSFLAYGATSGFNFNSGQTFLFGNTVFNQGNCYSTSTGRFTAPVAGTYIFYATAIGNNSDDVYRYFTQKNGVNYPRSSSQMRIDTGASGANYGYGTSAIMMQMNSGDYASIYFESNGTQSHGNATSGHEMFSGYLIG
jgi:hypothetical protein